MSNLRFDHLALSTETLDTGRLHVEAALGVELAPRGAHALMGTHNHLLSLGKDAYFEVIAIDPDARAPNRPRWFNIDNFSGAPRLTNWILATDDLDATLRDLPAGFGVPVAFERGDFKWSMAVPDDGILPWGGWGPAIIQWHGDLHPAPLLPDQGIRHRPPVLRHPQADKIASIFAPLLPRDTILFEQTQSPSLSVTFDTPGGMRSLT